MATPKPPAATIFTWLRNNKIPLRALTSHDAAALQAAVQIADLWLRGDHENRDLSAVAFHNAVMQMQPKTRYMAFHAIAHPGDWCHRWELWSHARLPIAGTPEEGRPENTVPYCPECAYGPRRAA
jgi:hypothetical protein